MSLKKKKLDNESRLESEPPSMSATDSNIAQPPASDSSSSKKGQSKHKKRFIFIIIIIFVTIYYIFIKFLRPEDIQKPSQIVQGQIKFNSTLSKNYTWITQKLDHFSQDQRTWNQRILLNFEERLNPNTPILLSIPDLAAVNSALPFQNLKPLCKKLGCLQIALEPRYFGQSYPLGEVSWTTDNLQYLTLNQMVEDIANLIRRITSMNFLGVTPSNPWILASRSKGAIAAILARAKYPQLTSGIYLSSPILSEPLVPNVSKRLYEIVMSGGKKCLSVIHALMVKLQEKVYGDQNEGFLLQLGKGTVLRPEEAQYYLMDGLRMINRNGFVSMCSSYNEEQIMKGLQQLLFSSNNLLIDPLLYSVEELTTSEQLAYFDSLRSRRAHQWLRCSSLGLFEVYSSQDDRNQINFKQLNQAYFRFYCFKLFGKDIWPPPDAASRLKVDVKKVTKAFVVQGHYDVWLPYSWQPEADEESGIEMEIISCSGCNHDFDAKMEKSFYKEVEALREKEEKVIKSWLKK